MSDPSVEQLTQIKRGIVLQNLLPGLEEEVDRQEQGIIVKAIAMLDKGELTPEQAMYLWMEIKTLRQLLRRVNNKVKVGQAAGQAMPKAMLPLPITQ